MINYNLELVLIYFIAGRFSWHISLIFGLVIKFSIDLYIALQSGFSAFGDWSLFAYSGFIFIIICQHFSLVKSEHAEKYQRADFFIKGLLAVWLYWLWTNFGTWLTSGLYNHTISGLSQCYWMALPFLKNSLISSSIWLALILSVSYARSFKKSWICYDRNN